MLCFLGVRLRRQSCRDLSLFREQQNERREKAGQKADQLRLPDYGLWDKASRGFTLSHISFALSGFFFFCALFFVGLETLGSV